MCTRFSLSKWFFDQKYLGTKEKALMIGTIYDSLRFGSLLEKMQASNLQNQGEGALANLALNFRVTRSARAALLVGMDNIEATPRDTESNPHIRNGHDFAKHLYDKYLSEGRGEEFLAKGDHDLFEDEFIKKLKIENFYTEPKAGYYRIEDLVQIPYIQLHNSFCEKTY